MARIDPKAVFLRTQMTSQELVFLAQGPKEDADGNKLCAKCYDLWKVQERNGMDALWKQMPGHFDLEDWPSGGAEQVGNTGRLRMPITYNP